MAQEKMRSRDEAQEERAARLALRAVIEDELAVARSMYVGHYATRAAFGEELLRDGQRADMYLAKLPGWLGRYVVLDGDKVTDDLEQAGHYRLVPAEDGVYAFENPAPKRFG